MLAAKVLRTANPNLAQLEFLDGALELAGGVYECGFEEQVLARVRNLFPGSVMVNGYDARKAIALLNGVAGSEDPAAFHTVLGNLVAADAVIDHDAVLATLVCQKPDRRSRACPGAPVSSERREFSSATHTWAE